MIASMVMCKPAQVRQPLNNMPSANSSGGQMLNLTNLNLPCQKEKVVLVMGATGAGKTRLSIDLATYFPAEIINSDKMQVYEGLDIVTNKITKEEQRGVPHHLLGTQNPNSEFTAADFCDMTTLAVESITGRGQLPIIVGGSNSYIEALIDDDDYKFRSRYDCCCLWVDVSMPVLHPYIDERVDQMFNNGMLNELRSFYNPNGDYSRGIRKAIGVPEFDQYFRSEPFRDEETRIKLLQQAIREVKENTSKLAIKQLRKIHTLRNVKRWKIHHLDATPVFRKKGKDANETWKELVAEPSVRIVAEFLYNVNTANVGATLRLPTLATAIATATC
ncbi:hypothetical protein L6164_010123 [Bauhinia variegata]|uniref:Uncharacterized protein n=1 Tax=Bauhinia variegata TaxID=167791 RepID=A0ACB9PLY5_BAUVA|nr:hypothetical protein L6164_010123 [Bauhinia variegata]